MRYLLWFLVVLGDVVVMTCIAFVLWWSELNLAVVLLSVILVCSWLNDGGFEAWKPSLVRKFLNNARDMGL